MELSKAEIEVLHFLREYFDDERKMPTQSEVGKKVGKTYQRVQQIYAELERKRRIKRIRGYRGIKLI